MKPDDLARRRERVRRINAKAPPIVAEVTYRPRPQARERLIDLLVELLDERNHSGQR